MIQLVLLLNHAFTVVYALQTCEPVAAKFWGI